MDQLSPSCRPARRSAKWIAPPCWHLRPQRSPATRLLLLAAGFLLLASAATTSSLAQQRARALNLSLPTKNPNILTPGQGSSYYMYCDRNFDGQSSKPWTAGKYGYVRTPVRTSSGIVYTRFHEGMDIKPIARDSRGEPLDTVHSISDGIVAHVNDVSGYSNYGKYIVIKHDWGYGPFYSLYAHLKTCSVNRGGRVRKGTTIGKLGYTGRGINRTRAHVHVELNMMLGSRFDEWHKKFFGPSPNRHGNYNGINLAGLDIAGVYNSYRRNSNLTLPQFMARMKTYYKVTVPRKGRLAILQRYPWLGSGKPSATRSPSYEVALSQSGIPLRISPSSRKVNSPSISWVRYSPTSHSYHTRKRLSGSGSTAKLTTSGLRHIQLITGDF